MQKEQQKGQPQMNAYPVLPLEPTHILVSRQNVIVTSFQHFWRPYNVVLTLFYLRCHLIAFKNVNKLLITFAETVWGFFFSFYLSIHHSYFFLEITNFNLTFLEIGIIFAWGRLVLLVFVFIHIPPVHMHYMMPTRFGKLIILANLLLSFWRFYL